MGLRFIGVIEPDCEDIGDDGSDYDQAEEFFYGGGDIHRVSIAQMGGNLGRKQGGSGLFWSIFS